MAAGGQLLAQGHPEDAAVQAFRGVGDLASVIPETKLGNILPAAGTAVFNYGVNKGLSGLGLNPENAELGSDLLTLGAGAGLKVIPVGDPESGMNFNKGINTFEELLKPTKTSKNLGLHTDIQAA
ncbi:MAG: hypothetical protein ACREKE_02425, partial [bacterium]